MSQNSDGFIDLRLNHRDGANQESFWPSFTDIMTVIVMIFMLAMVILLVRNMELVRQLRATMAAEREAMELARSTGEEKEDLALQLIAAENELSMLRVQQMRLNEQTRKQQQELGSRSEQVARLQAKNEALTLTRDQLTAEKLTLSQRLSRSESQLKSLQSDRQNLQMELTNTQQQLTSARQQSSRLEQDISDLQQLHESTQQQLADLNQRYRSQSEALQATQREERQSSRQLSELRGDFDSLQVEYNKLIRPARSPEGRYLVEVRYSKVDGEPVIEFATGEQPTFARISRKALNRRLQRLKQQKRNGLYVKVIFPEDSGLTYNEAWAFTSDMHSNYDYYSQEEQADIPADSTTPDTNQ